MFGTVGELDIIWEVQGVAPVDDLLIRLPAVFSAEGGPSNQAFEHNSTEAPPITAEGVALPLEDFRRDVIWRTDRGVSHDTTRFTPHVNLRAVADGQVDLVERDGVAITALGRAFEELLVVGVLVLGVEASTQPEVSELDVSTTIKKNVVGFDISGAYSME